MSRSSRRYTTLPNGYLVHNEGDVLQGLPNRRTDGDDSDPDTDDDDNLVGGRAVVVPIVSAGVRTRCAVAAEQLSAAAEQRASVFALGTSRCGGLRSAVALRPFEQDSTNTFFPVVAASNSGSSSPSSNDNSAMHGGRVEVDDAADNCCDIGNNGGNPPLFSPPVREGVLDGTSRLRSGRAFGYLPTRFSNNPAEEEMATAYTTSRVMVDEAFEHVAPSNNGLPDDEDTDTDDDVPAFGGADDGAASSARFASSGASLPGDAGFVRGAHLRNNAVQNIGCQVLEGGRVPEARAAYRGIPVGGHLDTFLRERLAITLQQRHMLRRNTQDEGGVPDSNHLGDDPDDASSDDDVRDALYHPDLPDLVGPGTANPNQAESGDGFIDDDYLQPNLEEDNTRYPMEIGHGVLEVGGDHVVDAVASIAHEDPVPDSRNEGTASCLAIELSDERRMNLPVSVDNVVLHQKSDVHADLDEFMDAELRSDGSSNEAVERVNLFVRDEVLSNHVLLTATGNSGERMVRDGSGSYVRVEDDDPPPNLPYCSVLEFEGTIFDKLPIPVGDAPEWFHLSDFPIHGSEVDELAHAFITVVDRRHGYRISSECGKRCYGCLSEVCNWKLAFKRTVSRYTDYKNQP
jgi:hypothetical protein